MRFSMIAYILLSIVIGLTVFQRLNAANRLWAAILATVLFILIFIFYGMRWFETKPNDVYKGVWPPIINMCPDYLVYFKQGGKESCVDMVGVNRSGGILKPWTKEDSPSNPPTDEAKYFNYVYKPNMNKTKMRELCKAAMDYGLTWEGITNGESCTF